jgi:hypothetical protein
VSPPAGKPAAAQMKKKTRAPKTFEVTLPLRARAKEAGITTNLTIETQQWLDHLLGACLLSATAVAKARSVLSDDDSYYPYKATVWTIITTLGVLFALVSIRGPVTGTTVNRQALTLALGPAD